MSKPTNKSATAREAMRKLETFLKGGKLKIAVKTNKLLPTDKIPEIIFSQAKIVYEASSNDVPIFQQSVEFSIFFKKQFALNYSLTKFRLIINSNARQPCLVPTEIC